MSDQAASVRPPLEVLAASFGFDSFRPGQERVVEALLAGRSALAVFPTGAGKSLCYQLPALLLEGVTLVVSPLIALMKDQIDFLQRSGIDAARLDSSLDAAEQREISERLRAGALKLLYVAPERFNNERFLAAARAHADLALRGRRGALHLRVGPQLPARLLEAGRARARARRRARAGADRDGHAGRGRGHPGRLRDRGGGRGRHRLLPAEPDAADDAGRGRRARRGCCVERLRERPPGSTIVYVTLQRTSLRVAAAARRRGPAGAPVPRRHEHRGARRGAGVVGGLAARGSWSRRSRSGWGSTRPTSATSTTTTCRRASSRTRRRSAAPAATARRASASCSPARTTCPRSRTSPSATRRRGRRWPACSRMCSQQPVGAEFAVSEYELSVRHDLRPLVLKTALTYLELDGVLRQGTPFYAGYRLRPIGDVVRGRLRPLRRAPRRLPAPPDRERQDGPDLDDARARRGRGGARRGAQPDRGCARVPRPAGPGRAAAGRGAAALHAHSPARTRTASSSSAARALRAPGARGDRADPERPRARHPRRLPGARPRRLLRRDARRAVRALQPLPERTRRSELPEPEPKPPIETSVDADGARGAAVESSRSARNAETAGALPRRHHQPGDDAARS